jgi:hypothetical protein
MREAFRGPFHGAAVGLGLRLRRRLGGEDQHTAAAEDATRLVEEGLNGVPGSMGMEWSWDI